MPEGWSHIEIAGKPVDVFEPGKPARFAILYLHSLGEENISEKPPYVAAFRAAGLPVVAPRGRRSWWADRVCNEFDPELTAEKHLLQNVVPWMEAKWNLGPRMIAVVGISMGGQGAVRLGFKYPERFPVVAGVASAFDYQDWYGQGLPMDEMYKNKEAVRQDTTVLCVGGPPWPRHVWFACDPDDGYCIRGNDRLHEKLSAYGIPHTIDFDTTAGGHCWEYFGPMAAPMMQFAKEALAVESRRLM